ncbi:ribonuclease D [Nocardioides sp. CFH 31398]|uniref:HRDC domain-containing protein n=1 Tax=Nocardioides sp. CFH 31398 TaxID=2919579 RepID=UPI001F055A33|nr:ribonuclease D [Nocardioides sp. CFH 31398]MCH1867635.1 ribonuclease D [Nocardioides sp. CFH 31398]
MTTPEDTTADTQDPSGPDAEGAPEAPPAELLTLRDGLPEVIDTDAGLAEACAAIAGGTGPVAIDAERASGYRYSARAYLVQLRREGSGTFLVDPIAFDSLEELQEVLRGTEWILHAATQDLPCLREVGLRPDALFDTELAGRLLGHPRVGLATLVETQLGKRLRKEHSAQDWSTRPLPEPWLEYAALDVEALVELRAVLADQLEEAGKAEWARQEFEALLDHQAPVRVDAWRRTSGMHKVRGRRGLAAVRELWLRRDEVAASRDVTPGRIIPDSAIVAAAQALPTERRALLSTPGFHGRGASRYASRWVEALRLAVEMDEADLPPRSPRSDGPPLPRAWAERDPVAAERLSLARAELAGLAEAHAVPTENLMTPDLVRRVLWEPPATRDPEQLAVEVDAALRRLGARAWQVELVAPVLVRAVLAAEASTDD